MRCLRILTNALLCGLLFAFLLALLTADLNVNRQVGAGLIAQLTICLALVYGLLMAVVILIVFVFGQFFFGRGAKPAFISPSFLSLGFSLIILIFLAIFETNVRYFSSSFGSEIRARLLIQMAVLPALALLGVLFFVIFRRSRKAMPAIVYLSVLIIGLFVILVQRARFPLLEPQPGSTPLLGRNAEKRITLVGLEGLSFDFIVPLVGQGKLPNFSWLMDNGNSERLIGFSPTDPISLEASFDTGKLPAQHRVLSGRRHRLSWIKEELDVVPRFILFSQLTRVGYLKVVPFEPEIKTKDFGQILQGNRIPYLDIGRRPDLESRISGSRAEKQAMELLGDSAFSDDPLFTLARTAFFRDWAAGEAALEERSARSPQVFHLRLDGLNDVQAYFYKYSRPQPFGGVPQEGIDRYGPVIERYYQHYDGLIGKFLTGMKDDEILVVYSAFGVEPLPLWKRFLERIMGDPEVSAHHEEAPDGVGIFYGRSIRKAKNIEAVRIIDIVPTLLYYLGLPVGRDMDGIVRSSLFSDDFRAANPVIYISSYDDFDIQPPQ
ncbi:MAG: hypothetical protein JXE07_08770 [Candidatus Aminicenantes bacterium]|nr:hypothetical protein [Candidatus Aminicenantes bacterium]